ncbi:hypothetical protein SAMN02910456_02353 [Ruminococcaceae bacterium YRB3002]|nr:hypothetical protein SAMN02910456_02353 [Ruminococcaceae bacterium YRB3002]
MDYLEGLFLGKIWSDTDFENRRHLGLFVLYGLLADCILLFNYVFGKKLLGIGNSGVLNMVLFIILFLACPFICFRYYRMPLPGKIIILVEKIFKSYLVLSFTIDQMMSRITVQKSGLQAYVIDYLNSTLETYTERFAGSAGSFATVIAVLAGGVHVVIVAVLVIAAAIVIPGLVYLIFVGLQYGYDWLINKFVIKRFFPSN